MKRILGSVALCMLIITSCIKEQAIPESINSNIILTSTYLDDFVLSGSSLKPPFRKIDSASAVTVFFDSVYTTFGGSLKHIGFQFSNANMIYRNLKLTVKSTNGVYQSNHITAKTTINNGIKEFIFDDPDAGLLLYPGWNIITVKAKIFGNRGDSFHVTIPKDYITYYSINDQPGGVVGLPISTSGLKIR